MAAQEKSVPSLSVANTFAAANDSVVAVVGGNTSLILIGNLLSVPVTNVTPANSNALAITAPATAWSDGNFLYVATANNVVKRVALSSF